MRQSIKKLGVYTKPFSRGLKMLLALDESDGYTPGHVCKAESDGY